MEEIRSRAKALKGHVVFPESGDPRVLRACAYLAEQQLCEVTLLGKGKEITKLAGEHGLTLTSTVQVHNLDSFTHSDLLADALFQRRKHKGISIDDARQKLQDPLYFGAMLVGEDYANGCVAGSVATSGDVIQAALQCIGTREGVSTVSSIFLMALPDGALFTYGDCGVVPYPDRKQLAEIAIESSRTHQRLTKNKPVVAMLSFSTKGSATHERVELVRDALDLAREQWPELEIDGELQFDAAYVSEVGHRKAPGSTVAGNANVYIFPNLDAGNIAYKITERLAGATATGPILQGLKRPMMDLSRGCRWEDIVNAACVAILLGEEG